MTPTDRYGNTRTQRGQMVKGYLRAAGYYRKLPYIPGEDRMLQEELNVFELVHEEFFDHAKNDADRYAILRKWRSEEYKPR